MSPECLRRSRVSGIRSAIIRKEAEVFLNCPECGVELQRIEHAGALLDVRPNYAGNWFEEDEILNVQAMQDGIRSLDQVVQPTGFGCSQGPYRLRLVCDSPLIRYH